MSLAFDDPGDIDKTMAQRHLEFGVSCRPCPCVSRPKTTLARPFTLTGGRRVLSLSLSLSLSQLEKILGSYNELLQVSGLYPAASLPPAHLARTF